MSSLSSSFNSKAALERQRKSLLQAVDDAREAEELRCQRLDFPLKRSEREHLEARFEAERERDQVRIERHVSDYKMLKDAVGKGDYDEVLKERRRARETGTAAPTLDVKANRFVGLEDPTDIICYKSFVEKFDKFDQQFQRKLAPKFNEYNERKQLQLLNQKRDLLTKLVSVHRNELIERDVTKNTNTYTQNNNNYNYIINNKNSSRQNTRAKDTRSVTSRAETARSSSTTASWATFASRSSSRGSHTARNTTSHSNSNSYSQYGGNGGNKGGNSASSMQRKYNIPILQLNKIN